MIEIAVLHRSMPALQVAGVVTISVGLISLALDRGWRSHLPALGAAVATGVSIAACTLIDAAGVRSAPVLVCASRMFLAQGPVLPLIAVVRRSRNLVPELLKGSRAGLAGGVLSLIAYGLVLGAQTSGATAAVAALRETSIVIGALIGVVFLGERLGPRRVAAAVVVAVGIALVSA